MVKCQWCSYVFYGALMLIGLGIIMGALFPAGRDPFAPTSSVIAMKGQWLYQAIVQNRIRHEAGEVWCDPNTCSNSMDFVRGVFNLPETKEWQEHGTYMGIELLWNVAIDIPDNELAYYGAYYGVRPHSNHADALRRKYNEIKDDPKIKCKCRRKK